VLPAEFAAGFGLSVATALPGLAAFVWDIDRVFALLTLDGVLVFAQWWRFLTESGCFHVWRERDNAPRWQSHGTDGSAFVQPWASGALNMCVDRVIRGTASRMYIIWPQKSSAGAARGSADGR